MVLQYLEKGRNKMSKILLKINDDNMLTCPCDGYVLGINNFSYLFGKTYSVNEIKRIKENTNKEIFVSFNRIIFNNELDEYKNMLKMVDNLGVEGIIVGDVSALTYNLKTNLILDQMHLNNSYSTINFYGNNKVNGVVLTNDITKDEINEIREKTNVILFKQVFGYTHLSTSKRMLVSNYLKHFKIGIPSKYYQIKEDIEGNYYKIYEDDFGCHILSDKPINLFGINIDVDYKIIDNFFMNDITDVIDMYINNDISKKEIIDNKYKCSTGFINKKTIYKVKKDE